MAVVTIDRIEIERPLELHIVEKKCCGEDEDDTDLQQQINDLKQELNNLKALVTTYWDGSDFT